MNVRTALRVVNGIFWLWMWLSAVMMPVAGDAANFWAVKAAQLVSLNPNVHDIPRLIGNAVLPLILWFTVDRIVKPKAKSKPTSVQE